MSRRVMSKQKSRGEENDFMLSLMAGRSGVAAGQNRNQVLATNVAATAAAYNAISAAITRNGSGKFRIEVEINISINGGSLADGDGVACTLLRGVTAIGPVVVAGAVTATGAPAGSTVTALVFTDFIDSGNNAALGVSTTYSLQVTSANGHTSGVVAGQGVIRVTELAA